MQPPVEAIGRLWCWATDPRASLEQHVEAVAALRAAVAPVGPVSATTAAAMVTPIERLLAAAGDEQPHTALLARSVLHASNVAGAAAARQATTPRPRPRAESSRIASAAELPSTRGLASVVCALASPVSACRIAAARLLDALVGGRVGDLSDDLTTAYRALSHSPELQCRMLDALAGMENEMLLLTTLHARCARTDDATPAALPTSLGDLAARFLNAPPPSSKSKAPHEPSVVLLQSRLARAALADRSFRGVAGAPVDIEGCHAAAAACRSLAALCDAVCGEGGSAGLGLAATEFDRRAAAAAPPVPHPPNPVRPARRSPSAHSSSAAPLSSTPKAPAPTAQANPHEAGDSIMRPRLTRVSSEGGTPSRGRSTRSSRESFN